MKEKKATITAKGASVKQWSDLMLELNLMKKSWHEYGDNWRGIIATYNEERNAWFLNDGSGTWQGFICE